MIQHSGFNHCGSAAYLSQPYFCKIESNLTERTFWFAKNTYLMHFRIFIFSEIERQPNSEENVL